jgi:hypothetical protein
MRTSQPEYLAPMVGREVRAHSAPDIGCFTRTNPGECFLALPRIRCFPSDSQIDDKDQYTSKVRVFVLGDVEDDQVVLEASSCDCCVIRDSAGRRRSSSQSGYKTVLRPKVLGDEGLCDDVSDAVLVLIFLLFCVTSVALLLSL